MNLEIWRGRNSSSNYKYLEFEMRAQPDLLQSVRRSPGALVQPWIWFSSQSSWGEPRFPHRRSVLTEFFLLTLLLLCVSRVLEHCLERSERTSGAPQTHLLHLASRRCCEEYRGAGKGACEIVLVTLSCAPRRP